ncbi:substrate-binding periplasmic protein [Chromobacterium haemolyticum]|uniref:substrate-binding periplasmic protein n=1 Tax=Chromobacterium haemolyticum TaxID=394935 RepID=UPI0040559EA7
MGRLLLLGSLLLALGANAHAHKLVKVAFGESLEPYVMEGGQNGLELEIVRAALQERGYRIEPVFFSQPRLPMALKNKDIDAVATVGEQAGLQAEYSDVYISYEDVAITLSSRRIQLHQTKELGAYRVLAFSLAKQYLGEAFKDMAKNNPNYAETANQVDQNRLLFRGSVDVVVADRNIFAWMNHKLATQFKEKTAPVDIHRLFPPTVYRMAFRSAPLRDEFNQGLRAIQKNGVYKQIVNRYQNL